MFGPFTTPKMIHTYSKFKQALSLQKRRPRAREMCQDQALASGALYQQGEPLDVSYSLHLSNIKPKRLWLYKSTV